jgi:hypothetical protein
MTQKLLQEWAQLTNRAIHSKMRIRCSSSHRNPREKTGSTHSNRRSASTWHATSLKSLVKSIWEFAKSATVSNRRGLITAVSVIAVACAWTIIAPGWVTASAWEISRRFYCSPCMSNWWASSTSWILWSWWSDALQAKTIASAKLKTAHCF